MANVGLRGRKVEDNFYYVPAAYVTNTYLVYRSKEDKARSKTNILCAAECQSDKRWRAYNPKDPTVEG